MSKKNNVPLWSLIQFADNDSFKCAFDDSEISDDAEAAFIKYNEVYGDPVEPNYQYGFRFVTFLVEEYGIGVMSDISSKAAYYDCASGDAEMNIQVIKEATSDDVFERFEEWLPENWGGYTDEYLNYMKQFGLE